MRRLREGKVKGRERNSIALAPLIMIGARELLCGTLSEGKLKGRGRNSIAIDPLNMIGVKVYGALP